MNVREIMVFKQAEREDKLIAEVEKVQKIIGRKLTFEEQSIFKLGYTIGERNGSKKEREYRYAGNA